MGQVSPIDKRNFRRDPPGFLVERLSGRPVSQMRPLFIRFHPIDTGAEEC